MSDTLIFEVFADGRLVDKRSWTLKIFMPKLELVNVNIEPEIE